MRDMIINLPSSIRASAKCTGALLCLLFTTTLYSPVSFSADGELSGVKQEITRQQDQLSNKKKQLNKLQGDLKKQELAISSTSKQIRTAEANLQNVNSTISELQQQRQELEQQRLGQLELLKELLTTHYLTQRNNNLANVLSGKDVTTIERMNQYSGHLAKARVAIVAELDSLTARLKEKEQSLTHKKSEQNALLAKRKKEKNKLLTAQSKRKKTVSSIRKNISSDNSYLNELQQNEKRLKTEIAKAAKASKVQKVPMDGLGKRKGKLIWPLSGKALHNFGTKQTGRLTWKGIVLSSDYGKPVKAVYSGKVVFADYLRGYGLLMLIDHGKGDMTLYGYNQSLMKKEGELVQAGETIALAGDTGGQDQPSLYFEIRRNSKAQNPKAWLRE